jgi:hypothetical protein
MPAEGGALDVLVSDAWFGTPTERIEVEPGDRAVPLTVGLVNNGLYIITKVGGWLTLPPGMRDTATGGFIAKANFSGTVNRGAPFTLTFLVDLEEDVLLQEYATIITIQYTKWGETTTLKQTRVVQFRVTGRSDLKAELVGGDLKPGEDNQVALRLTNRGTATAGRVTVALSLPALEPAPLSLVDTDGRWTLQELAPGEVVELPFTIHASPLYAGRVFTLPLALTYYNSYGDPRQEQRSLGLRIRALDPARISLEAELEGGVLLPGQAARLNLTLANQGAEAAYRIDLKLALPQGAPPPFTYTRGDGHWVIDQLSPGGVVTLPLELYVGPTTPPGAYQLVLTATYQDRFGTEGVVERVLGLRVASPVEERISLEALVLNPRLAAEVNNTVRVLVRNRGWVAASEVEAVLSIPVGASGLALIGSDGHFSLGDIEPGEATVLELVIYAAPSSQGATFQLPFTLTYRDEFGNQATASRSLGLRVEAPPSGLVVIDASLEAGPLKAGAYNELQLVVRNLGTEPALGVEVSLTLPQGPTAPLTLAEGDSHLWVGNLEPGGVVALPLKLYAAYTAQGTAYQLPLTVSYRDRYGNLKVAERLLGVRVSTPALDEVALDAELSADALVPGSTNLLTLTVRNTGTEPAYSLDLTLKLPEGLVSPLTFIATDGHWRIKELGPGGEAQISFKLYASPGAAGSAYQLPLTIRFRDRFGTEGQVLRVLGTTVAATAAQLGIQVTTSTVLTAGLLDNLTLTLTNNSPYTLKDVAISVASTSPRVTLVGQERWFFGEVAPQSQRTFRVPVYPAPEVADQAVTFTVTVEYTGEGGVIRSDTVQLGIYIQGLISLRVYDVEVNVLAGNPFIVGNLLNEGNREALFTTVTLIPADSAPFTPLESVYLGDLNPDAPLPFSIPILLAPGFTPGEYPVTVQVTYKDALRNLHTKTFTVKVRLEPPPQEEAQTQASPLEVFQASGLFPALVVVVVAVLLYAAFRRRRSGA